MSLAENMHPGRPVPLSAPGREIAEISVEISAAIDRVLASGYFIHGQEHAAFEREFAAYCGVRHCIGVANGTDALEIALRAVGCGRDDEVVTVANAGAYTTAAAYAVGAIPVYADIDPATLVLDPRALAGVLSPRVKAVVVTHLYGYLADVPAIERALREAGSKALIVEDCAQAHGALRRGRRAGAFGDIAIFSFYPTKNLAALGDGGALVTNHDQFADAARSLRQYGWDAKYDVVRPGGRNSRLDELQAAILRAKLPHLNARNERRRAVFRLLAEACARAGLAVPHAGCGSEFVAHLCVARHSRRSQIMDRLAAGGIGAQVHYPIPDHRQKGFDGLPRRLGSLTHSERACDEVFSLPCFPEMSEDEIAAVCAAIGTLKETPPAAR